MDVVSGQRVPEVHGRIPQEVIDAMGVVRVDVNIVDPSDPSTNQSATSMCNQVAGEVMDLLGIGQGDRSLSLFGSICARAALAKLVTSQGFTVRFGDFHNFRERVDVELRPPEPIIRQAKVTSEPGEQ